MNNVFIFRCNPPILGPNIIGYRIERSEVRRVDWKNSIWLKKARVIIPTPNQHDRRLVDIQFALLDDTPIGIGMEDADGIAEFPIEMFWRLNVRPKPRILSDYMSATSGIALPVGAELPKEMRQ